MAETNPELQSSITCFRQVKSSNELEKFLVASKTIARDLFGINEKFMVKLPDTLEDFLAGDGSANMESASTDVATTFRPRSLRSTLYQMHGPPTYDFNSALARSYDRITRPYVRSSSRVSRSPSGKKTLDTRPNTLMPDIRAVQENYYVKEVPDLEVIIDGIRVVKQSTIPGTLFGLAIDRTSIGAEILVGQKQVIDTALAKMVAVRNTKRLANRGDDVDPLAIPFAYVPYKVNGEGEIYIDEVGKLARSYIATLQLLPAKWTNKPSSD